jgi:hypothetical protein
VLRLQAGNKLSLETASLLGVEITDFLRNIKEGGDGLVVALFFSFLSCAASTADLNGELLTLGVTNILAGLLLNVLCGTRGLIDSPTHGLTFAVADLLERPVALPDILCECLLLKGDLTDLLKVLLAHLLLSGAEHCDISVVAFLHILVCALKDGVLLQGCHSLRGLNATKASIRVILTPAEINPGSLDVSLAARTRGTNSVLAVNVGSVVGGGDSQKANNNGKGLKLKMHKITHTALQLLRTLSAQALNTFFTSRLSLSQVNLFTYSHVCYLCSYFPQVSMKLRLFTDLLPVYISLFALLPRTWQRQRRRRRPPAARCCCWHLPLQGGSNGTGGQNGRDRQQE